MANKKNEKKKVAPKVQKKVATKETVEVKETKKESRNGTITILVLGAIIVFLIALFIPGKNNNQNKSLELTALKCEKTEDNIENDTKLNKVSCNGYQSLVQEEKDNLILIARPTCSYCIKFVPILEQIVEEYGIVVNYFDTDTLSEKENSQFYESSSLFSSSDFGTPTLIITNNNKIKEYSIGYKEKEATVEWLKNNGIIGE